jgi:hypothetical protein
MLAAFCKYGAFFHLNKGPCSLNFTLIGWQESSHTDKNFNLRLVQLFFLLAWAWNDEARVKEYQF